MGEEKLISILLLRFKYIYCVIHEIAVYDDYLKIAPFSPSGNKLRSMLLARKEPRV